MLGCFFVLFDCYGFVVPGLIYNMTNLQLIVSISSSTPTLVLCAKLGSYGYQFLSLWYDSIVRGDQSHNCKAYLFFLHCFKEKPPSKGDFLMNFSIKERRFVNECDVSISIVTSWRSNVTYTDIFFYYKIGSFIKDSITQKGVKFFCHNGCVLQWK